MRIHNIFIIFTLGLLSCYDSDIYKPNSYPEIFTLSATNNTEADGVNKILLEVLISEETQSIKNNEIEFIINFDKVERISVPIKYIQRNGKNIKIAEASIKTTKPGNYKVEAKAKVDNFEISKEIEVEFLRSLPESVNVTVSSLKIKPDSSFNEIFIFSKLSRKDGFVSIGTICETIVLDTIGNEIGIFPEYILRSDSTGLIKNRFTLGLSPYKGKLKVKSMSIDRDGKIQKDSIFIYSI